MVGREAGREARSLERQERSFCILLLLVGGIPTPLKNVNVNWDDDIPKIWENKSHVPNHQPDIVVGFLSDVAVPDHSTDSTDNC